ncbi:metallophosphoesterase family protein [Spirochaeta africana]|uniref:DNA repair exonuclease n=1 Tax=Spirochaeta africana (strain ATCC 700263 / DSM 8902 / Z-7692) TaxID=889378 RepID=H9UI27_SPIAZ|nr:metallophosphoesterase [Spirochaeta africana]AFG37170.1 DNA repair exonuclease [Spirochaeta africana DSM 8902]
MTHLIHCADLHLSRDEREYGEAVLREILGHARTTDALLLCGDTFDSYADLDALQGWFVELLQQELGDSGCRVLLLPGNHEYLRAPAGVSPTGESPFARRRWGPVEVLDERPLVHLPLGDGDVVAIPHREGYADYPAWEVPPRSGSWRIVMAHAAVAGLHYLGPEEEPDGGVLDPDLFRHCQADYAALGHIHRAADERHNGVRMVFPGSARVWRAHETGARQVMRLQAGDGGITAEPLVLQQAGQFRQLALAVAPDGSCELPAELPELQPQDWLQLELNGVIENEQDLEAQLPGLTARFPVRSVTVKRSGVLVLRGIRENPFVQRFEECWHARLRAASARSADGLPSLTRNTELLMRARTTALREIYAVLQDQT